MKKIEESNALLNVLCLEDTLKDAELLNEMLVDAGYLVNMDFAEREEAFISFLKSRKYHIILADYTLPGFNAPAALKLALELQPEVPFICVSGTIGEDTAVELLKQGATDYVLKDRLGRLAFAVRRALEGIELQKELAYQNKEKEKRADELILANKELAFQNKEKEKRAAELVIANKELHFQNEEKEKRAAELVIANKELTFQNREKEKRAAELVIANKELHFQNEEKEKRAAELILANKELAFQNREKEKRAAELIIANKELAFQNKEKEKRAAELIIANKELEQFAYVASHDLQEPLRMVASFTQLLERRYKDKLDADANDFIHFAVDGAIRMQKLINDLLEYSRISTRGKIFEQVNTSLILGQVISNLQLLIIENAALISNDDLPVVKADESQILHVFQNLIENAIKFKKKSEFPKIHISCKKTNNFYEFSVRDNGIGIEMQYHDRVFTIFQRLHSVKDYPGTGIGLSICKHIVERHGGTIWFDSKENAGTTFYFTIPV